MDLRIGNVLDTKRGNQCLVIDNFKLSRVNVLKNGHVRFRCTNRSCNANVIVTADLREIVRTKCFPHNHEALLDASVDLEVIRTAVKRRAAEDPYTKPNRLIRRELLLKRDGRRFEPAKLRLVRKSLTTARRQLGVPRPPETPEDALAALRAYAAGTDGRAGRFGCHVSADGAVATFACAAGLRLLCESGATALGDGRAPAPTFFRQLYAVHVYDAARGLYAPAAYCLLSAADARPAADAHRRMWAELRRLCGQLAGRAPDRLRRFYADADARAHAAARDAFPGCRVACGFYHVARALHRRIRGDAALRRCYADPRSDVGNWLKYFYGLPFLPPAEVGNGFAQLVSIAPGAAAGDAAAADEDARRRAVRFSDYVLDTFVAEDAEFPPAAWAAEPSRDATPAGTADHGRGGPAVFRAVYDDRVCRSRRPHVHQVAAAIGDAHARARAPEADDEPDVAISTHCSKEKHDVLHKRWNEYKTGRISLLIYIMVIGHVFKITDV